VTTSKNMDNKPRIFLSYRRKDQPHAARSLSKDLGQHFTVFRDSDSIRGGQSIPESLLKALARAQVLLVLIGRGWLSARLDDDSPRRIDDPNDWVRQEIEESLAAGKVIIPVLVDDTPLPDPTKVELPPPVQELVKRRALPLRNDEWKRDVEELIDAIQAAMGGVGRVPSVLASRPLSAAPPRKVSVPYDPEAYLALLDKEEAWLLLKDALDSTQPLVVGALIGQREDWHEALRTRVQLECRDRKLIYPDPQEWPRLARGRETILLKRLLAEGLRLPNVTRLLLTDNAACEAAIADFCAGTKCPLLLHYFLPVSRQAADMKTFRSLMERLNGAASRLAGSEAKIVVVLSILKPTKRPRIPLAPNATEALQRRLCREYASVVEDSGGELDFCLELEVISHRHLTTWPESLKRISAGASGIGVSSAHIQRHVEMLRPVLEGEAKGMRHLELRDRMCGDLAREFGSGGQVDGW
jgi:hypothetical protein